MGALWILGDQLQHDHPALSGLNKKQDRLVFIESQQRGTQLPYHQLKLVLVFAAMRGRAAALREEGWQVDYHEQADDFTQAWQSQLKKHPTDKITVMEPSDHTMTKMLPVLAKKLGVPLEIIATNSFLVTRAEFGAWAEMRPRLLMEHHYRRLRKKLKILVDKKGEPEGGAWNFDADNRQTHAAFAKARMALPVPPRQTSGSSTQAVIEMVRRDYAKHPGDATQFWLPVTRSEALAWLHTFIQQRLAKFGPWEDVMSEGEPVLFHGVLSPLLNLGLLRPQECLTAVVEAYEKGDAPLSSVEGFVRQIMGWREFINGIYWHRGPEYLELNALNAERELPDWMWTGETELNCLRQTLQQVLALGYNHHIQRLMVLGNFFLLGGFNPRAVLNWYNTLYVDAYEWVMAANVIGMILHADGGYMATKPYAAGAGYINRMSNYCAGCRYDPDQKTGAEACPFNYLYWNFFAEHEARFAEHPRLGMMLKTWQKKPESERKAIRAQARDFLEKLK